MNIRNAEKNGQTWHALSRHRKLLNVCKGMNTYWTFHPTEDFLMCAHNVGLPSCCSVFFFFSLLFEKVAVDADERNNSTYYTLLHHELM